jgi:uncharacterized protein YacL
MIWKTFGFIVLLIVGTILHGQQTQDEIIIPLWKWVAIITPLLVAIGYQQIMLDREETEYFLLETRNLFDTKKKEILQKIIDDEERSDQNIFFSKSNEETPQLLLTYNE